MKPDEDYLRSVDHRSRTLTALIEWSRYKWTTTTLSIRIDNFKCNNNNNNNNNNRQVIGDNDKATITEQIIIDDSSQSHLIVTFDQLCSSAVSKQTRHYQSAPFICISAMKYTMIKVLDYPSSLNIGNIWRCDDSCIIELKDITIDDGRLFDAIHHGFNLLVNAHHHLLIDSFISLEFASLIIESIVYIVCNHANPSSVIVYSMNGALIGRIDGIKFIDQLHFEIEQVFRNCAGIASSVTVSHHISFRAFGIDSLLVQKLENQLRDTFRNRLTLPSAICLHFPSINAIADEVYRIMMTTHDSPNHDDDDDDVAVDRISTRFILAPAQQRLAFLHFLENGNDQHYIEVFALRLNSCTNLFALRSVINLITQRHAILRTIFSDYYEMIVQSATETYFHVYPLYGEHNCNPTISPFQLTNAPPSRFIVYRNAHQCSMTVMQHHIITDGWSVSIMLDEIGKLYQQMMVSRAECPQLPPLALQYMDYALSERKCTTNDNDDHIEYWMAELNGCQYQSIPIDKHHHQIDRIRFVGNLLHFSFSASKLQLVADSSVYATIVSLFGALIYSYYGLTDLCIGMPVANRPHTSLESLIGLFVNTLVIRLQLTSTSTFASVAKSVQKRITTALMHSNMPFDRLVDRLNVERNISTSSNAIFQTMIVMDDTMAFATPIAIDHRSCYYGGSVLPVQSGYSKYDQSWYFARVGDQIIARVEYNSDLYHRQTIANLINRYLLIIDRVSNYGQQVLLTKLSIKQHEFATTTSDFPADIDIASAIIAQSNRTPSAVACVYQQSKIIYSYLDEDTNRLARCIEQRTIVHSVQSIRCDDAIAIWLEQRDMRLPVFMLALIKLGVAFVPIDKKQTTNGLIVSDIDHQISMNYPSTALNIRLLPRSLAYITYTSGSTGQPKGVCTEHIGLLNLICNYNRLLLINSNSVIYQLVNYTFDICSADIFQSLMNGARLILARSRIPNIDEMCTNSCTHAYIMPAFLSTMRHDEFRHLRQLEMLSFGGEQLMSNTLSSLITNNVHCVQQFGFTEHSVFAMIKRMHRCDPINCVGKPMCNYIAHLIDEHRNRIDDEAMRGELISGGCGVARGYMGRINRKCFQKYRSIRFFVSGDILSRYGDYFYYHGRRDSMIKLRGLQVEIGEIETIMSRLPLIEHCVVLIDSTRTQLIAYYQGAVEDVSLLRDALRQQLPEHMVPSHYIKVDQFPLTVNGKVDRLQLPPLAHITEHQSMALVHGPRTEYEQIIHSMMCAVIGCNAIDINASFFDIGGNSLKAMQLVIRLQTLFGVHCFDLRSIFELKTIVALAQQLAISQLRTDSMQMIVPANNRAHGFVLSDSQRRLWIAHQLESHSCAQFNIPLRFTFTGAVSPRSLHIAINSLTQWHSALRTIFINDGDGVRQYVLSATECYLVFRPIFGNNLIETEEQHCFDLHSTAPIRLISNDNHSFSLIFHHIIVDGWSLTILAQHLTTLYNRFTADNVDHSAHHPSIHYVDYCEWQHAVVNYDTSLEWWQQRFIGYEYYPDIVHDFTNGNNDMLANSRRFELNDGLLAQLHQHAHNLNCTPFVLLLAAYMITISCLSSRLTVCVATPVANRNHEQVQTLVGSFINTIMVLVDIHPTNTISQTIANVRSTLLDALQHQHVPYDLLVERLSSSSRNRHTGHPQLFQTMFLMQNNQELPMMNGITSVNVIDAPMKYAKCELTWMLAERGADLVVDIEYNATLFHADTIDRIMTIYRRILFEIVTNDGSKQIHQLSLVNDIESHQLMQVYATRAITDTPDSYPIGVIIRQQSLLLPHAILTVSIDYQHLTMLANIIGRRLQQQMIQNSCSSIRADDIVAICCINESNAYVCIVIALSIGCGYVPCDRQWPNARLRHIIHETNSRMLLTDYDIDDECIMVVNVVQEMSTFDKHNNCRSVRSIDMSTSLAYIIYTSGTSGTPKGVCINQQSVINIGAFTTREYVLHNRCRLQLCVRVVFDGCIAYLFGALFNGSAIISTAPLHIVHMTPAVLSGYSLKTIKKMSRFIEIWSVGGDRMSAKMMNHLLDMGIRLLQVYGPTEATCFQTIAQMKSISHTTTNIGLAIDNLYGYVISGSNQLIPIRMQGELVMAGDNIARGYMNKPTLSELSFVPNHFASMEQTAKGINRRLYRSGDIVSRAPDGAIIYVGRNDRQVKINGYRIELQEIESTISSYRDVHDCVVIATDIICAFYLSTNESIENDLMIFIQKSLPLYMIPNRLIALQSFPINSNGKIDIDQLKTMMITMMKSNNSPRNEIERLLIDIWKSTLDIENVGIDDDFFALGGHSILAIQIATKVQSILGRKCHMSAIFEYPTIVRLCEHLLVQSFSSKDVDSICISNRQIVSHYPLSPMQNGFTSFSISNGQLSAYNCRLLIGIDGQFCSRLLQIAFNRLIAEQNVFRTIFELSTGQTVLSATECFISTATIYGKSSIVALNPFDGKPTIRVELNRSSNSLQLTLSMHHIIVDDVSMRIVVDRLLNLYSNMIRVGSLPSPLLPTTITYCDYSKWLCEQLNHNRSTLIQFWTSNLQSIIDLNIKIDKPHHPTTINYSGASYRYRFKGLGMRVRQLCRQYICTPFMILLSAFNLLLYVYSIDTPESIAIGIPISVRSSTTDHLVGLFINTLIINTTMNNVDESIANIIGRIRKSCIDAYEHRHLPFDEIIRNVVTKSNYRITNRTPIFQAMFVYGQSSNETVQQHDLIRFRVIDDKVLFTKYELTLFVDELNGDDLCGNMEYFTSLFYRQTIERMLNDWAYIIEMMSNCSTKSISDLKQTLIRSSSSLSNQSDYPNEYSISEIFNRQASIVPDICAAYHHNSINYSILQSQVSHISSAIIQQYIQTTVETLIPDTVIGVGSLTGFDRLAVILGVVSSGGTYLPFDDTFPSIRLDQMFKQTSTRLCLTECSFVNYNISSRYRWLRVDGNDVAYAIYTSGSTGTPKCCCIAQSSIINSICQATQRFFIKPITDRIYQFTNYIFDNSILEILLALLNGAALCMRLDESISNSPQMIVSDINSRGVTHALLYPGIVAMISRHQLITIFRHLRYWIVGAEACPQHLMEYSLKRGIDIIQNYGPTETAACVLTKRMHYLDVSTNLGTPIDNVHAMVTVDGSICIGGANRFRGYFGINDNGGKVYNSGDIGKQLHNSDIVYIGRSDRQVKIRGFRIELNEIESRLLQHPAINQCTVNTYTDRYTDELTIVAHCVIANNGQLTNQHLLRDYLSQLLPIYMIPNRFIIVDHLPLTANNKLDRNQLIFDDRNIVPSFDRRPRSELAHLIHNCWCEVFGTTINCSADFFDLGGHSLHATQIAARITLITGKCCSAVNIFIYRTVDKLTEFIQNNANVCIDPIRSYNKIDRSVPLSYQQEQMWFLYQQQQQTDRCPYNLPFIQKFSHQLNTIGLHRSLLAVCMKQTVLRTIFVDDNDGRVCQQILSATQTYFAPYQRLLSTDDYLVSRLKRDHSRSFDLTYAPPFRCYLYRNIDNHQHILLMTMAHSISDAWSTMIMESEIGHYYQQYIHGIDSNISPLIIDYCDYSIWQRESLISTDRLAYWQQQLADVDKLRFALNRDINRLDSTDQCGQIRFRFDDSTEIAMRSMAISHGLTLNMITLGSLALLLTTITHQNAIIIGVPTANRTHMHTECIQGYFLNNLAIRIDINRCMTIKDYFIHVKSILLAAYDNEVPFEYLMQHMHLTRSAVDNLPLFQVYLNCRYDLEDARHTIDRVCHSILTETLIESDCIFNIEMDIDEGQYLSGAFRWKHDLYSHKRMTSVLDQYLLLTNRLTSCNENELIGNIDILPDYQREQLLTIGNGIMIDSPNNVSITQLIDMQQRLTPNMAQIADTNNLMVINYADCYEMTSRMASALKQMYIATTAEMIIADTIIILCVESSIDAIIGILSILETGAGFLSLPHNYPSASRQSIIDTVHCKLVVCNRTVDRLRRSIGQLQINNYAHYRTHRRWCCKDTSDLSCLFLTSGTTGQSKIVAIDEDRCIAFVRSITELLQLKTAARIFNFSIYTFDNIITELFGAFINGATLLVADSNLQTANVINQSKSLINYLFVCPSFLHTFDARTWKCASRCIELLQVGGETMNASLIDAIVSWNIQCIYDYGPTEAIVFSTAKSIKYLDTSKMIGRPIPNVHCILLDEHQRLAPMATDAEICMVGGMLARGYWHRDDDHFMINPYQTKEEAIKKQNSRLYRSGDIGRWTMCGELQFVGRIDSQIKLRGRRIDLIEIELAMQSCPHIDTAIVTAHINDDDDNVIIGHYVSRERIDEVDLRRYLAEHLMPTAIPTYFDRLDHIDITEIGKTDRGRLTQRFIDNRSSIIPSDCNHLTSIECEIIQVWQSCLAISNINREDNFFLIGGNSLMILRVRNRLEIRFKMHISINDLFKFQTVRELAQLIETRRLHVHANNTDVLIRIKSCDDARIDIYFFHPLVGGAFYPYRSLIDALHFDASVNIYGIQHPNTFDDAVDSIGNIQTIEQLVAYYLSSIVFASDRPYLLIGASLGAILAYEAEVQLQMRAGRCATGILIIDSVLPTTDNTITKSEHTIQMRQILESYGSELHDSTLINAMINNAWHLLQMAGRYRAHTSINARVCVLRVVDSISDYDSWQRYCRQPVTIHHIAGTHSNMLNEKHAQLLAIQIKTIFAQQFDLCL